MKLVKRVVLPDRTDPRHASPIFSNIVVDTTQVRSGHC